MVVIYFSFSFSLAFLSWMVGLVFNSFLKKSDWYSSKLSHLNFIKKKSVTVFIGLKAFKWIVKNTFFKYLNQKLKLSSKAGIIELHELRKEMTFSEISHLIGFVFMSVFVVIKLLDGNFLFAMVIMVVNLFMNLYPSLLQQENKRRIDAFIKRLTHLA